MLAIVDEKQRVATKEKERTEEEEWRENKKRQMTEGRIER